MRELSRWECSDKDKKRYIDLLVPNLGALRAKAGISQDELSRLIGVSRQTYGTVERGNANLSWNTYLGLILFFYLNDSTREMLRSCGALPDEFLRHFNPDTFAEDMLIEPFDKESEELFSGLDEQGKRTIRNMAMVEYARANDMSLEAVVKAFEGPGIRSAASNEKADKALAAIKRKKN